MGPGPRRDGSTPMWPAGGAGSGQTDNPASAAASRSTSPQNWVTATSGHRDATAWSSSRERTDSPVGVTATTRASGTGPPSRSSIRVAMRTRAPAPVSPAP